MVGNLANTLDDWDEGNTIEDDSFNGTFAAPPARFFREYYECMDRLDDLHDSLLDELF